MNFFSLSDTQKYSWSENNLSTLLRNISYMGNKFPICPGVLNADFGLVWTS